MTRLIKFPLQVTPQRVTTELSRVDAIFPSVITNVQQIASRGSPVWKWVYEYRDLSLSEREIVEAFLLACKGSINTFKVRDPADYAPRGVMSGWTDQYSGHGSVLTDAGSTTSKVNSYFGKGGYFDTHITEDGQVIMEWNRATSTGNFGWMGQTGSIGEVDSLEGGAAYCTRIKMFPIGNMKHSASIQVGTDSTPYQNQSFPVQCHSADTISATFVATIPGVKVKTVDWVGNDTGIGDTFALAEPRFARCGLVTNSQNQFLHSEAFMDADWTFVNASVNSGYQGPIGDVSSDAFWFRDGTSVNTTHYITQQIVKVATEGIWTFSLYAKRASTGRNIQLMMDDQSGNQITCWFWVWSGTAGAITPTDSYTLGVARMYDVGSQWYRCSITACVTSKTVLRAIARIASGGSNTYTGNNQGPLIFGAQLEEHPMPGRYTKTESTAIIGSDGWTGSTINVAGLEPRGIIKTGQRFELITHFHVYSKGQYEKSEFKRITREVKVRKDGWAELEFDPPIRNAPELERSWGNQDNRGAWVHNPVIFSDPEMKARLLNGTIQYIEKPLQLTDVVFEVVEDLAE
jgi:hypothetical protein